ncbi:MAG: hypothetical protein H6726_15565 [Sandaracinaceae bacterium]|nr:hypothetical protein [Sandaracinaceae bacterium]
MTFTEAAVEVLRLVGKPLHYKAITDIAIERELLSHLGKSPEITMNSRLATMVKKDRGDAPIIKVKPGVFGLREFDAAVIDAAMHESGQDFELPEPEVVEDDEEESDGAAQAPEGEAAEASAPVEKPRPTQKLPGQDVFPEEEDDDEPILANLGNGGSESDGDDRNRKRRRRRRGRKDGDGDVEQDGAAADGRRDAAGRGERDRGARDRDRNGRNRRDRGGERGDRVRAGRDVLGDWEREPGEGETVGIGLVEALERALSARQGPARSHEQLAQLLVEEGRLQGSAAALAPTVAAAVRADNARAQLQGARPRFRVWGDAVELTDWSLPNDALRAEAELRRALARQQDAVRRGFLRMVGDLPNAGLLELVASWLNAEGVVGLRAVRRPGSQRNEFHLAGTLRQGPHELPLAVIVYREGHITRERVVDVRGSLHHYGNARVAWLVGLAQVVSGAREEAAVLDATPCALLDGAGLAEAMERVGVGIVSHQVRLSGIDADLMDMLKGPGRTRQVEVVRTEVADDDPHRDEGEGSEDEPGQDAEDGAEGSGGGRRRRRRRRRGGGQDDLAASDVDTSEGTGEDALASEASDEQGDGDDAPAVSDDDDDEVLISAEASENEDDADEDSDDEDSDDDADDEDSDDDDADDEDSDDDDADDEDSDDDDADDEDLDDDDADDEDDEDSDDD